MKKLLFLFMLLLLCACSSSSDEDIYVQDAFVCDGKKFPIDKVYQESSRIIFFSGSYEFHINHIDYEKGKKFYMYTYENARANIAYYDLNDKGSYKFYQVFDNKDIDHSSYVLVKDSEEDNRTYYEVYIRTAEHIVTARYLGVPKDY